MGRQTTPAGDPRRSRCQLPPRGHDGVDDDFGRGLSTLRTPPRLASGRRLRHPGAHSDRPLWPSPRHRGGAAGDGFRGNDIPLAAAFGRRQSPTPSTRMPFQVGHATPSRSYAVAVEPAVASGPAFLTSTSRGDKARPRRDARADSRVDGVRDAPGDPINTKRPRPASPPNVTRSSKPPRPRAPAAASSCSRTRCSVHAAAAVDGQRLSRQPTTPSRTVARVFVPTGAASPASRPRYLQRPHSLSHFPNPSRHALRRQPQFLLATERLFASGYRKSTVCVVRGDRPRRPGGARRYPVMEGYPYGRLFVAACRARSRLTSRGKRASTAFYAQQRRFMIATGARVRIQHDASAAPATLAVRVQVQTPGTRRLFMNRVNTFPLAPADQDLRRRALLESVSRRRRSPTRRCSVAQVAPPCRSSAAGPRHPWSGAPPAGARARRARRMQNLYPRSSN